MGSPETIAQVGSGDSARIQTLTACKSEKGWLAFANQQFYKEAP